MLQEIIDKDLFPVKIYLINPSNTFLPHSLYHMLQNQLVFSGIPPLCVSIELFSVSVALFLF